MRNELGDVRRSQIITTHGPGSIIDFRAGGYRGAGGIDRIGEPLKRVVAAIDGDVGRGGADRERQRAVRDGTGQAVESLRSDLVGQGQVQRPRFDKLGVGDEMQAKGQFRQMVPHPHGMTHFAP